MKYRIIDTTDNKYIGNTLDALPVVGQDFALPDGSNIEPAKIEKKNLLYTVSDPNYIILLVEEP